MGYVGWEKCIAPIRSSLDVMRECIPGLYALQVPWKRSVYLLDLFCGYEGRWQPEAKFDYCVEVDQTILSGEQDQEQVPVHQKIIDVCSKARLPKIAWEGS